ncbi:MurR/RpiR family transcriptional regulator [Virgibacillus necropolis]|uniref:MurR/RpiR family transcriptional regulator n=1 Tax=Virgibacillus necropolis TaxID=163877 RepID=UPI00384D380B
MKTESEIKNTLLKIQSYASSLTKAEATVANYVISNSKDVIYLSITDLAEKADVGETTVLRFCRKLGFRGFQDFKLSLAQDQVQPASDLHEEVMENDDAATLVKKIVSSLSRGMEETRDLLDPKKLEKAIQMIVKAKNVHFYGVGSSGVTAAEAAHSFTRIGKSCDAKQDTHFQAISASLMSEDDVAVGFSISGSTKDTNDNLKIAKDRGAYIICVTHNARSPITKISDVDLLMSAKENPLQGSSLLARISQLAIVDILCTGVSMQMKETAIKYRERTAKAVSEKFY